MQFPEVDTKIKIAIASRNISDHLQEAYAWELEAKVCQRVEDPKGAEKAKELMKSALTKVTAYQEIIAELTTQIEAESQTVHS